MAIGTMDDFKTKKNDLEAKIAAAESEAQLTMDMSEVEKLNKEMEHLESTKHQYEEVAVGATEIPAEKLKQVTDLGGSESVLEEKLKTTNEEIRQTEKDLEEKVSETKEGEKKAENVFDAILAKRNEEKTKNSESMQLAFSQYPDAAAALKDNPTSIGMAKFALEQKMITPDEMVSFIQSNPELSNKKEFVSRFIKESDAETVQSLQKSKDVSVREALYAAVGNDLSKLQNMQGPDKRNNLLVIAGFAKMDRNLIDLAGLSKLDKNGNAIGIVKDALRSWMDLVKTNPQFKNTTVERASPEDLKALMKINGLGLSKEDVIGYLKEKVASKDLSAFEKAVDLSEAGVLSREEIDSLLQ